MSKRSVELFLNDILEAIERVRSYTHGHSLESFDQSRMTVDAVVRNLEIIGEAAKHIPSSQRQKYPQVPWKRVVGFRNIAIHDYFAVDVELVWTIATEQLDELETAIKNMLEDLRASG
ncbi:MAG: DUF86 domain-containing protein [Fimbriimonadales bacterium]|nr:DUF86 domain-containing protein [Fimbriimonadales bacterium]